jgi:hypothetical protein
MQIYPTNVHHTIQNLGVNLGTLQVSKFSQQPKLDIQLTCVSSISS